jgi:predicted O-methyltransferase YrrM
MNIDPLSFLFEGKKDLVVAEIGVYKGGSTVYMLENFDIQMYYAIDPFVLYDGYYEGTVINWFNEIGNGDKCYEKVKELLSKYHNVELIREYSHEASKSIKDNELDVCYIDGNHKYEYVYQDIGCWFPKIKEGGVICGDDVFLPDVIRAVRYFFDDEFDIFIGKRSWLVQK